MGRLRSFTVFGRNFPEEPTTTAEEREGFLRGGVAQLINDHSSITWRLPDGVDLRDMLLRCNSCLGPRVTGSGAGEGDVRDWADPAFLLSSFGLAELASATDRYIGNMRLANVTLVPMAKIAKMIV